MKYDIKTLKEDLLGKIISIYPSDKFTNSGWGEVTKIDDTGRIMGSWGDKPVIPGEDIFELVGAPTLIRDRYIKSKHCLR